MTNEYLMTTNAIVIGPMTGSDAVGTGTAVFGQAIQSVHDGLATLNANPGDLGELLGDATGLSGYILTPEALGQLLMQHLPNDYTERLHPDAKVYWMQVAEYMGPDHLPSLRKVAAFMDETFEGR